MRETERASRCQFCVLIHARACILVNIGRWIAIEHFRRRIMARLSTNRLIIDLAHISIDSLIFFYIRVFSRMADRRQLNSNCRCNTRAWCIAARCIFSQHPSLFIKPTWMQRFFILHLDMKYRAVVDAAELASFLQIKARSTVRQV